MTHLNEKTINYLVKEYSGEQLSAETVEKLIADVTARLTKPRKRKFPEIVVTAHAELTAFNERIAFYNEVVNNTVRKLHTYFTPGNLLIPAHAVPFKYERTISGEVKVFPIEELAKTGYTLTREDSIIFRYPHPVNKVFIQNRPGSPSIELKTLKIPVAHLWNDPITVAQYVRKLVSAAKEEDSVTDLKNAAEKVNELNDSLKAAVDKLNKVSTERDRMLTKIAAAAEKKEMKKLNKAETTP